MDGYLSHRTLRAHFVSREGQFASGLVDFIVETEKIFVSSQLRVLTRVEALLGCWPVLGTTTSDNVRFLDRTIVLLVDFDYCL